MCIRSPNEYLGTKTYHKQLVDVIIHHLFDFYAGWSSNIAFPELAVPAIVHVNLANAAKAYPKARQRLFNEQADPAAC